MEKWSSEFETTHSNGKDTIIEYNDGNHQEFRGTFDVEALFESLKESDEDFDESVWLEENGYDYIEETA